MNYSVLIITKDEEVNIKDCLDSVASDDIWVLDSLSTDQTKVICTKEGVNFIQRKFDNYANQRNFGLSLAFKNEWILMLDADERLPNKKYFNLSQILHNIKDDICIISVLRKDFLGEQWLKGASGYPTYFPRIFRKGTVVVNRQINEEYVSQGRSIKRNDLFINHYPFNKGISYWFERHNFYSSLEAKQNFKLEKIKISDFEYFHMRQLLKKIAFNLPLRPFLVFIYFYIYKKGFMSGKAGYNFALMRMTYEIMIDIKRDHEI